MTIRHSRLLWAAVVPVVLLELGAAGLAFRNDMPAAYRAYYIDQTTDCWPHVTAGDYALGTTLSFVAGHEPLFFPNKVCGWFYPSPSGTWSYGRYSLLRFNFAPRSGPLRLRLVAGAMVNPDAPTQRVVVSVNGSRLATLSFTGVGTEVEDVTIPVDLAGSGRLEVRFDYPDARPGNELGLNQDSHLRAIRMVALTLGRG